MQPPAVAKGGGLRVQPPAVAKGGGVGVQPPFESGQGFKEAASPFPRKIEMLFLVLTGGISRTNKRK